MRVCFVLPADVTAVFFPQQRVLPSTGLQSRDNFDLIDHEIVVRKRVVFRGSSIVGVAFADYDLIIYREPGGDKTRADYFDNEGHVIPYTTGISADKRTITFRSDPQPSQPAFRLTYNIDDNGRLGIKFEIAPPTAPEEFKVYVEGFAHKASG